MLDYKRHPLSGKTFECYKDIIITPFWPEDFCLEIINFADDYRNDFTNSISFTSASEKKIGWDDFDISKFDENFFQNYVRHFKQDIEPILQTVFTDTVGKISGWFPPYIIKYDQLGQKADVHNDVSHITFNVKLNNTYQGCDLYFPRQQFNCKDVSVGYAIIWPSTITHPHGSTELENGVKYSFVSWTWPPAWQRIGIEGQRL